MTDFTKKESVDLIIATINETIAFKKLSQKEIYETLIGKSVIEPNTENDFRKFFEWALSNGYIDETRLKRWSKKRGKLPRYFTKKQLERLFNVIERPKDGICCFMALMCGLRISEICNLQIQDINFEDSKLFIKNSKNPNRKAHGYGKDRIVRFDPAIIPPIKKWLEIIGESSKWFLPSDISPEKPLRKKSVHERFRHYLKQSNLDEIDYTYKIQQKQNGKRVEKTVRRHKYYFHCLRHTMASMIYNKTGDIYAVKEFLGHESIDTTTVYAKMTETKMRGVIASVFSTLHYNYHDGNHLPTTPTIKSQTNVQTKAGTPLELLEIQYINGDISEQEFMRKKQVLNATNIKTTIELKNE